MDYDPNMRLAYADDATAIETSVEIIDPNTGEHNGFTCDNLTSVMYFLVAYDLRPIREGLRDLRQLHLTPGEDLGKYADELAGNTAADVLEAFRAANNLPLALYIEVHGDPALVEKFTA